MDHFLAHPIRERPVHDRDPSMLTTPSIARPPAPATAEPSCRLCGARLHRTLLDLGAVPLSNRTLAAGESGDTPYPLHARICDTCTLVQVDDAALPIDCVAPVVSAAGRLQTRRYVEIIQKRLRLTEESVVIEVGRNDGTLSDHFQSAGIPVLRIDTIETFNTETAMQVAVKSGRADFVVANDVLQHAPDLFDFAAGLASLLRPNGVLGLQVPHLLAVMQKLQFDAFRHDAYSYFSLRVLEHVLRAVGLRVFDAEALPGHGGSIRVHACHAVGPHVTRPGLKAMRLTERCADLDRKDFYSGFADRAAAARADVQQFVRTKIAEGRRVAGYGASTRAAVLLNYCGLTPADIACIADPDPALHGRLMPGSRIPIVPVEAFRADPPDDIVIFPWPHAAEIAGELTPLRHRGTHLWTAVPRIARV